MPSKKNSNTTNWEELSIDRQFINELNLCESNAKLIGILSWIITNFNVGTLSWNDNKNQKHVFTIRFMIKCLENDGIRSLMRLPTKYGIRQVAIYNKIKPFIKKIK